MGQSFGFVFGKDGHRPQNGTIQKWKRHLAARFPGHDSTLDGGRAAQNLLASLDSVVWGDGDSERGAIVFAKLNCSRCHGGRKALGPDLQGVTKRFLRPDLFAAIVDPNRNVPERYQITTIVTTGGKTYSGLIVYESVDGVLLRDADHRTYRIEADDIETKVRRRVSLMPGGLLKNATNQDLADLDAYLRAL